MLDTIKTTYTREQVEGEIERLDKAVAEHTEQEKRHHDARVEAERDLGLLRQLHAYITGAVAATGAEPTTVVVTAQDGEKPKRRQVSKREPILQIMREHRDRKPIWTAPEMRKQLEQRGIEVTGTSIVRVTMHRMVSAGQLAAAGEGQFRLPD